MIGTKPPAGTIGSALFGLTRQRVLGLLFGRPESRFFLNEIVREAGLGKGTVQRELASLIAAGLIESRTEGRQRYFQASRESPVFSELEALVRKTFGLAEVLRNALEPLASRIRFAGVYGSIASGTAHSRSDVDLLVVGEVDLLALAGVLVEPERALGRSINPTLFSEAEWKARLKQPTGFIRDVLSKPLMPLIGAVDELGKPGQVEAAAAAGRGSGRVRATPRRGPAKPRGRRAKGARA